MTDLLGPRSSALTHLRRLSGRRRARLEAGQFVIDGPTLVAEAIAAGVDVVAVYAEPDAPAEVLSAARAASIPVHAVAAGALAKATSPVTPQSVAALASLPDPPDDSVLHGLVLVLVGVGDPGNAGTVVRVAEASGASAVVSCADAVDLWNPKCVRASAGSLFRVPVVAGGDAFDAIRRLRGAGMTVLATALDGSVELDDVDLCRPVAVLLGNEAHGLPADVVAGADVAVRIPMAGAVESLNVAVTGTIIAFEAARQRRAAGGPGPAGA